MTSRINKTSQHFSKRRNSSVFYKSFDYEIMKAQNTYLEIDWI